MPTVEEILKQSGFNDEQIKALDQKAITAFGGMLSAAERANADAKAAREAAELAERSNVDFYENRIAPSLVQWEQEKARLENEKARVAAEAAFYRTQAEEAKKTGFIAAEAPTFDASKFTPPNPVPPTGNPPRDSQGRYVANAPGATPGSPTFLDVNQLYERAGNALGIIADIEWEHQRLFGKPMPLSPSELIKQADAQKLDPKTYASRTFNFDARRLQMQQEEEKANHDKIAAEAIAPWEQKVKDAEEKAKKDLADLDRKWAERTGNNPDVRVPQVSPRNTEIQKGIKEGTIPDPLSLNDQQRRALTSQMIRKDIEEGVLTTK